MEQNLTDKYIDYLFDLANKSFPDRVIHQAKRCILDYIGVTLAGAKILRDKDFHLLEYFGSVDNSCTLIGLSKKSSIQNAVFINGLNSHVAELDDGVRFGVMHPGAAIISALIPVVEAEKISGEDFVKGVIMGYEGAIRIANAMQPSHRELGFHTTGTCGTLGATIGIAFALGFSKKQLKNALTAAITSASGMLKVMKDGSDLKPFNAGNAALNGLNSAFMARAGFNGANELLTGKWGFMTMLSEESGFEKILQVSDTYQIEKIYVKPYAACRHCHPAIEASLILRDSGKFDLQEISQIDVITYNAALNSHDHTEIDGITSAKMSTPFSVAVALHCGKAGIDEFTPQYINDSEILATNRKVKLYSDTEINKLVPHKRVAIVEILTKDGSKYTQKVEFPKGEPENPLSLDELKVKFSNLAQHGGKPQIEYTKIIETVMSIENRFQDLFRLIF